ncbi:hypothetical protein B0H67DRAFT_151277 [Lasiosphaeris hirsuta]|uniref:Uncharacterized protein n=1 Tax=Lasiosphaeris hirsuta TaxID=260670 RepID=A0AA40AP43_9PEZI|nr:hypothetical protein B0H67DRAFT_151277 [Lasiosphaeris hirsuta]
MTVPMSEKSRRAAPLAKQSSKEGPNNGSETFSARFRALAGNFGSLLQDADGLQGLDDLINERLALREELQRKDAEIDRVKSEAIKMRNKYTGDVFQLEQEKETLESSLEVLITKVGARHKAWEEDKIRHEAESAELSRLQHRLTSAQDTAQKLSAQNEELRHELDQHRKEAKEQKDYIAKLDSRIQRRQLQLNETVSDLKNCREVLHTMEEELGLLPLDEEQAADDLDELSDKVHRIAWKYFYEDGVAMPAAPISGLQPPLSQIPQVATDSSAARCMRAALAEAVVAQELSESIFTEYYNLNRFIGIESGILVNAIATLARTHPVQALIMRAQLTKACNSSRDVAKIPARAAESVATVLGGWIGEDAPRRQRLLEELEAIFSDAMAVWQPLQRARKRITTRMALSVDFWDEDEDKRDAYDNANDDAHSIEGGGMTSTILGPMAILFPQVLADNECLFHGNALFHTQHAVLAAARENSKSQQDRQGVSTPRLRRTSKNEARLGRRPGSASAGAVHHKKPPNTPTELSYIETQASLSARGAADSTISKSSATA